MIQINSISFSFGAQILFNDFSLSTNAKCACIAGNNGVGKSTLLKLAAGILELSSGKIKASGETIYVEQECGEIPQSVFSSFWSADNEARKFQFLFFDSCALTFRLLLELHQNDSNKFDFIFIRGANPVQ